MKSRSAKFAQINVCRQTYQKFRYIEIEIFESWQAIISKTLALLINHTHRDKSTDEKCVTDRLETFIFKWYKDIVALFEKIPITELLRVIPVSILARTILPLSWVEIKLHLYPSQAAFFLRRYLSLFLSPPLYLSLFLSSRPLSRRTYCAVFVFYLFTLNWKQLSLWKLNCWCSHISGEFISSVAIHLIWLASFISIHMLCYIGVFFLRLRSLRICRIALAWLFFFG